MLRGSSVQNTEQPRRRHGATTEQVGRGVHQNQLLRVWKSGGILSLKQGFMTLSLLNDARCVCLSKHRVEHYAELINNNDPNRFLIK